jgi:4'-phosphopantetheinyl transferase
MEPSSRDHLDGSIVVWMANVEQARDSLVFLDPYLDQRDRERAGQFRFEEDHARFVLGRCLVRKCLGLYLRRNAETIELAYTDRGRPLLANDETVQFSISHTHDLVAIALTAGAQIGIDLEYVQPDLNFVELAARIFSQDDLQTFQALSPREMPAAFFRAWTRKEAYLKARGEGIGERLRQVSVSWEAEEVGPVRDLENPTPAWRLLALPVPVNYIGSLACADPAKRLECSSVHFDQDEIIRKPCADFKQTDGDSVAPME